MTDTTIAEIAIPFLTFLFAMGKLMIDRARQERLAPRLLANERVVASLIVMLVERDVLDIPALMKLGVFDGIK